MSSNKYLRPVKQLLRFIPDRAYIQLYYLAKFGRFCNLNDPITYNEKLQWLKLNYRVSGQSKLVDKYEVKQVVADTIGAEYIVPTLAMYDTADDIDFNELPDRCVLKCTHDSEGLVFVRGKSLVDTSKVRAHLRAALRRNFYYIGREYHYRDLAPRIIAEPLLEDETHGQILDYKFFCFDGEIRAMFVGSDRGTGHPKFDYFSVDYSPLDIRQSYPPSEVKPSKPERYEEMLDIARALSIGHPHIRVDLYEVNGRVYFGELTFFHFSGFAPFHPPEWDHTWGAWLTLPDAVPA